jgi:hypothetical protein
MFEVKKSFANMSIVRKHEKDDLEVKRTCNTPHIVLPTAPSSMELTNFPTCILIPQLNLDPQSPDVLAQRAIYNRDLPTNLPADFPHMTASDSWRFVF